VFKIYAAFSETCWRQKTSCGEFDDLEDAVTAANLAAKEDNWLHVDFVVALNREVNTEEFHRVKSAKQNWRV